MGKSYTDKGKIFWGALSLFILAFLIYFFFYSEKVEQEPPEPQGGPALPSSSEEMPAIPEVAEEQVISGEIGISSVLVNKVKKGSVLFVMAKLGKETEGPPVAVTRIEAGTFPVPYSLSLTHGFMGNNGNAEGKKVWVTARLDQDGNASTRQPGDLIGFYPEPVAMGSSNISFELNQEIPSENGKASQPSPKR